MTSVIASLARRTGALLAIAASVTACNGKDSEFFTFVSDNPGRIRVTVDGTPAGADVRLTGVGVDVHEVVAQTPRVFAGLALGDYLLSVTPPAGYSCDPEQLGVALTAADPEATVAVACQQVSAATGTFQFSLNGLGTSLAVPFTLTGPTGRTGTLGTGGLTFPGLAVGGYTWSLDQIGGYNCLPDAGAFTLTANALVSQAIDCNATEGSLQVTVNGATAPVQFTGPESGGASIGATPVTFPNLTPGTYTVGISPPQGSTCQPLSTDVPVTAGNVASVVFTCAPQVQPTFLSYDLTTMPIGSVFPGSYTVGLRDGGTQHATTTIYTIGTQTFSGNGPLRLGAGFSSGYGLSYGPLTVFGQPWTAVVLEYCILNATLDAAHPVTLNHRNAGGTLLGSAVVTTSPTCGSVPLPAGSTRTEFIAPTDRFFDFNMIRIGR